MIKRLIFFLMVFVVICWGSVSFAWTLNQSCTGLDGETISPGQSEHFDLDLASNGYHYVIVQLVVTSADTASKTASTIAFVDSNPDTITDSGSGFVSAGFLGDMTLVVTGSPHNNGTYTIDTVSAGTITLKDSINTAEGTGTSITLTGYFNLSSTYNIGGSVDGGTTVSKGAILGNRSPSFSSGDLIKIVQYPWARIEVNNGEIESGDHDDIAVTCKYAIY